MSEARGIREASTPVARGARRCEIIGHRGSPREAPENSLASFERALAHGVDAVELDTHVTADGVAVVHHDPIIGAGEHPRIAGRAIAGLTWAQLDAGRNDDRAPAPRLADVLDLVAGSAVVYVELKGSHIESAVIDCIQASRAECAVHAFDHRAVARARTLRPDLRTGILLDARLVDPVSAMRDAGATDFWQQWKMIDEDLVTAIHEAGGKVIAWTVNDADAAASLIALGIDGLCTDVPGLMMHLTTSGS